MFDTPYQYFFAVARTNSFRKAAEELFVSQPAVSRQIRLLEERLGYPLFYRTTRRVTLSREGKLLYEALLECDMAVQRSRQAIRSIHREGDLSGHLRVGIHSGWSAQLFLLPCFSDFADRYPGVRQSFFCHGFLTLAADTEVIYKVTDFYSPEHDRSIRYDDPAIGIDWPVAAATIMLSDKDRVAPLLADAEVFS